MCQIQNTHTYTLPLLHMHTPDCGITVIEVTDLSYAAIKQK